MSGRKLRWLTAGLFATGGAGLLTLTAMMNSAYAFGETPDIVPDPNIGLVMGGTGIPIPGPDYVQAADNLYLSQFYPYPDLTFFQATSANPLSPGFYGNGLFTPEQAYPLFGGGVHQLYYNLTDPTTGLPGSDTSVGQGAAILESTILADQAAKDGSTVFGYSQSSTLSGITMQLLDPTGANDSAEPYAPQFLLIADPNAPNGGLFERFNGYETINGDVHNLPLNLPSFGVSFDGATPSDDFVTNMYTLEYDGFADFPRYPINFLSDLNAFLGIATLHGTYLNQGFNPPMPGGPTAAEIAAATANPLPGSAANTADSLTNYYMIDETPPLVSLLPQPLQDLLGPDLTYLINLGYGDGTLGYSITADSPANVPTPFGLFPDVSASTVLSTLATDTQNGITAFEKDLSDPAALLASLTESSSTPSTVSLTDVLTALEADFSSPEAASTTLTDLVNAISSASSTAYSTLLPLTDIANYLSTSVPVYLGTLFTDNLQTGDLVDAFGLPIAANTAIDTLSAGFGYDVISDAASQIAADFSGLF